MLSLRPFSPMAVRFASNQPSSNDSALGTHHIGSEILTFTQVGSGIRITQAGENRRVLELQPNGITVNGGCLDASARKGLARVFKTFMANKNQYSFEANGRHYQATVSGEAVVFQNPSRPLESLSIKPDLIRIAEGQVNEKGRKDLIAILQQLLKTE